jgi:hypothetical protein
MKNPEKSCFSATVDRIEGDRAVLELPEGEQTVLPLFLLPQNIYDGAVLKITIEENPIEEETRRAEIAALQERLLGGK